MELMHANREWARRPNDERFLSLIDMQQHFHAQKARSRQLVVSSRDVKVVPQHDNGLAIIGKSGYAYQPTHWSFGQLAALAGAPAGYLRNLPAPLAVDCLNYGIRIARDVDDVGLLLYSNGDKALRAATGPRYGRVWNATIIDQLVSRFGDGVTGHFRVPGEFGKAVNVDKQNTTLYASDRDFFVFLADEERRITIPNRRNGRSGSLARGFFCWNSEVGASTFGLAVFLFDFACQNRIVWGAEKYKEIRIRHTASAPDRWIEEVAPAIQRYAQSSESDIVCAIEDARRASLGERLDDFLANRFSKGIVESMHAIHLAEEGRPIETRWDVTVAATAVARSIPHQDERVKLERIAGMVMTG